MPRTLQCRSGSPHVTWAAMAGRVALAVLFGLGVLVPSLGRVAPVAAQASTVSFSTAEVAPADSIAYLVMTLDDQSEQWRLADDLLDRAGLGKALDEELENELHDEAGQDIPLDAFLGGEVGIVVSPTVLQDPRQGVDGRRRSGIDAWRHGDGVTGGRAGRERGARVRPGAGRPRAGYGVDGHQGLGPR